jgi:hypothetical protein
MTTSKPVTISSTPCSRLTIAHGRRLDQYVILGAGFAQRRPEIASRFRVFEIDQPSPPFDRARLRCPGPPIGFEAGGTNDLTELAS